MLVFRPWRLYENRAGVIIFESQFTVEDDTGHVTMVFRWRCSACDSGSCWLVESDAAFEFGSAHAAGHLT